MRIGRALATWLDDPGADDTCRAGTADAARAIAAIPALAAFRAAMPDGAPVNAAQVRAAVDALFADTGWCGDLLAILCERLGSDAFFLPPLRPFDNGLHAGFSIHDDARVAIALGVGSVDALSQRKMQAQGARALILPGHATHLRFVRGGGAIIAFHALDAGGRLRPAGHRHVADGCGFAVDGRRATWTIEHATSDLVLLQAVLKDGGAPFLREFDPATGVEIPRSTNDEAASRAQIMMSLLGAMERADAAPAIAGWLAHDAAFMRWHAMRELVPLDGQAALPGLMAMAATDPDREVRDAARATLALLKDRAPCPA